jgi:hypothetical protein
MYEDAPDFFKIRDADGAAVLCHECGAKAENNRAVIPCSLCGKYWHLDCLDPPLAIPPVLRQWRCPAHVEQLQSLLLGPAHRWRHVKGASAISPVFARGLVNNGFIEVDDDSDDESGWADVKTYGRIYRLPAKGIKLDFMER